jgi:hypothetical protein
MLYRPIYSRRKLSPLNFILWHFHAVNSWALAITKHRTWRYRETKAGYVGIGDTKKEACVGKRLCQACVWNFLWRTNTLITAADGCLTHKGQISILPPRLFPLFIRTRATGSVSSGKLHPRTRIYNRAVATRGSVAGADAVACAKPSAPPFPLDGYGFRKYSRYSEQDYILLIAETCVQKI